MKVKKGAGSPPSPTPSNYKQQHSDFKQRLLKMKISEESVVNSRLKLKRIYLIYLIILICIGKGLMLINMNYAKSALHQTISVVKLFSFSRSEQPANSSPIPVYYINLDDSVKRNEYLTSHLKDMKLNSRRVRAFTPEDVRARVDKDRVYSVHHQAQ
jgi:hypothetical protein